ncbi:hypothetical protein [Lysinibacillus xylanilyticus]|uniref:Apea-like HEPN domain-containing protein n=1 Tax=Lysinibacillus xylanilyticus TaxID=582475 RepID=A0A2M9Q5N3_9BACI|nr:hypothetical protein [Lysinibacillus xylanilyticus]PJO43375.1 hypothetical protein CWD94_12535 [Lysinibacillus xylanilyticus]
MEDCYSHIIGNINNDKYEVDQTENKIIIHSKITQKKYCFNKDIIPKEKIEFFVGLLMKLNELEFIDVDEINSSGIFTKVSDNENYDFLLQCIFELKFEDNSFVKLNLISEIVKLFKKNVHKYENLEVILDEDQIILYSSEWRANPSFKAEDLEVSMKNIKSFFEGTYIDLTAFYEENYIEFSITFPELENVFGVPYISEANFLNTENDKVYFEINKISEPFFNFMIKEQEYGDEESYDSYEEVTLKIYNVNKELQIGIEDDTFYEVALNVTKNIIFNLSYKYGIDMKLSNDSEVESIEDQIYELSEKIEKIQEKDLMVNNLYDKDLVNYFYRALQMENSEFKYMAFYQVLECIYDEVLMANTVESIRQLISSNWFDYNVDENISFVIEKIKLHNSSKKDEDKLKLILEKYFRGTLPDEVFLEVNKEIAELLMKMGKIKNISEIKDLQKIQQTIYRFRCDCTHSNRAYPIKRVEDNNSISDYINLIKLVSTRIILNYK